ncbi:unnamed protein product [Nezara viridula]|uniref:Uncharacterized protein n=1 Tax=Nezara viridula TaxID=85310 RepID=A0A9P0H5V7_NEZVI|nr:unnamed protein product [Nezara viridula]
MKVPFGHVLGPFFKQHSAYINIICKPCLFGSQVYLMVFSVVALIITISDLNRLIGQGCLSPSLLKSLGPKVCPTFLKNSKLIGSGINIYTYLFLLLGVVYNYPVFLMPYLFLQFLNISLLAMLLTLTVITNWSNLEKKNLPLFGFMVHNWLQVFCFFRSCLHVSDF